MMLLLLMWRELFALGSSLGERRLEESEKFCERVGPGG